jgi:hypothetical protein
MDTWARIHSHIWPTCSRRYMSNSDINNVCSGLSRWLTLSLAPAFGLCLFSCPCLTNKVFFFPWKKGGQVYVRIRSQLNKTFGISMFLDNCIFRSTVAVSNAAFLLCSALSSLSTGHFFFVIALFPGEMSSFCSTFRFTNSSSHVWFPSSRFLWPPTYFPYVWKSICNSSLELVLVGLLLLRFALRCCQVEHQRWAPFYVRFVSVRGA